MYSEAIYQNVSDITYSNTTKSSEKKKNKQKDINSTDTRIFLPFYPFFSIIIVMKKSNKGMAVYGYGNRTLK